MVEEVVALGEKRSTLKEERLKAPTPPASPARETSRLHLPPTRQLVWLASVRAPEPYRPPQPSLEFAWLGWEHNGNTGYEQG
jgi:hypothetical protein